MRLLLAILLIVFSYCAYAQQRLPVAVANAYKLTEADGFPGSNYVGVFEQNSSGKIYAKDFFGNLHITGNNFIKRIPGLKNITNLTTIKVQQNGEVLIYENLNRISIIKNDSLWRVVESNKNLLGISPNKSGRILAFERVGDTLVFYEFKNELWTLTNKAALPPMVKHENVMVAFQGSKFFIYFTRPDGSLSFYELDTAQHQIHYITTLSFTDFTYGFPYLYNSRLMENTTLKKSLSDFIAELTGKLLLLTTQRFHDYFTNTFLYSQYVFNYGKGMYEFFTVGNNRIQPGTVVFETKDHLNSTRINPAYPYVTVLTGNKPMRVFPYIKKYPRIYDNDNANNIFALAQDDSGRIWAANYQNKLSILDPANAKQSVILLKKQSSPFMDASLSYNGNIFLVGENINGGILQYDMQGNMRKLQLPLATTGYYLYLAHRNRKVYFASAAPGFPVFYCDVKELEKPLIHWDKLDSTSGIQPFSKTSITEDTLGRIWMGHPQKGFAVYDPAKQKGITYTTYNNESPIGFISSLTDSKGTVWMGSDGHGLWYYKDYRRPATPQNIHNAYHPLLNTVKRITSMAIYKNWLVLGCYDRVCLMNLDSFYQKKKIIVRYLNPQEAAFTSLTEQNTMLVSKTDSSLWFSTSDMLYQWDTKTWLSLPKYKVQMAAFLHHDSTRIEMNAGRRLKLPPQIHGFDIVFEYLSPDCLPRYTRTALALRGDSVIFTEPGMRSRFSYQNLSSGIYTFYIEVFEQDGTRSTYRYTFIITKYIWQHWWFWTLASLLFIMPFVLWLNTHRKKALQEKEIASLNVITMSSQFRPHFILNTLNTIGADLKDKPGAESIISRLGESVNLIFNYAQQKKVSHTLQDEWMLINNVIEIHQIIYLPQLEVKYVGKELLETYKGTNLPLGILEINVENALLHGLRNKQLPPYNLKIAIHEDTNNLYFTIEDNGIGLQQSMAISSHNKHGTGTQNLHNIIGILNRFNKNKIEMNYIDELQSKGGGTVVKIKIPKIYHYEY